MEVHTIASMMVLPREGRIATVFQMFLFLKSKHNGVMSFDSIETDIVQTNFQLNISLQHLMFPVKKMFLLILLHPDAQTSL